jgi:hypothetical protein
VQYYKVLIIFNKYDILEEIYYNNIILNNIKRLCFLLVLLLPSDANVTKEAPSKKQRETKTQKIQSKAVIIINDYHPLTASRSSGKLCFLIFEPIIFDNRF